ncbi:hypothetical protein ACLMJK_004062 [Lecanora helva]
MYSAAVPATTSMNGIGGGMVDGTINPAALNTPGPLHALVDEALQCLHYGRFNCECFGANDDTAGVGSLLSTSSSVNAQASPRGQKRSRSPEQSGDPYGAGAEDDDQKRKKRGRLPKDDRSENSPPIIPSQQAIRDSPDQQRTPQLQSQSLPQDTGDTPTQNTPPKATGNKPVIKALPTVRDHTTDQLTLDQDEYIPREFDEAGEHKVSPTGEPLGGRQFKMRTFYVAHRGDKRFMLATECARVLGYRDSYLLFNKNRSLHKIIATQQEKDELIHQEILPYSYRSRQIAIVTAKSMFRQFGARVIEGGRRVRDDYWEAKAIKQGFTEEDLAGDKRPGATRARDAAAAAEANQAPLIPTGYGHQQDIIYANAPMDPGHPPPIGGLPLMKIPDDSRMQAYTHISRPRQEMTGAPYQDRTQPTPVQDVLHQASNAAELNKQHTQHRATREKLLKEQWNREPDIPASSPQPKSEHSPIVSQSPHLSTSSTMMNSQQPMMQHQSSQMMSPQSTYSSHHPQTPNQQNPHAQSRSSMPSTIRPELSHQHRSSLSYPSSQHNPQGPSYGYSHQNQQMWGHPPPHPQPHQSPISSHHTGLPHYSPSSHQQQPNIQHHPSQSPHPQPPRPSLHHNPSSGSMHSSMGYQTMAGMPGGPSSSYSNPAAMANVRAMYSPQSTSPSQQQYMPQQQQATTAAQQGGMQGWAPPPQHLHHQQQQPGQGSWQGYPSSTGY